MTNTINGVNSTPVKQKKKSNAVKNGALIGAGIGAASGFGFIAHSVHVMKKSVSTEDEYVRSIVKKAKKHSENLPENIVEIAKAAYPDSKKAVEEMVPQIRKGLPIVMLVGAAVVGALGAGIGAIVKCVSGHKADKAKS